MGLAIAAPTFPAYYTRKLVQIIMTIEVKEVYILALMK